MNTILKFWYVWAAISLFLTNLNPVTLRFAPDRCPATRANFCRLRIGMREDEVEAILGSRTIAVCGKRGHFAGIWCNGDVFPAYSDHIEIQFGRQRKVESVAFRRAPIWNKIELLLLPRDRTSV